MFMETNKNVEPDIQLWWRIKFNVYNSVKYKFSLLHVHFVCWTFYFKYVGSSQFG